MKRTDEDLLANCLVCERPDSKKWMCLKCSADFSIYLEFFKERYSKPSLFIIDTTFVNYVQDLFNKARKFDYEY